MNPNERNNPTCEIAAGDEDVIEGMVLRWAGLSEDWDELGLGDEYAFLSDVLEACLLADVDSREWDAGAPGRSGVWFVVSTTDPEGLRTEIHERVRALALESVAPLFSLNFDTQSPTPGPLFVLLWKGGYVVEIDGEIGTGAFQTLEEAIRWSLSAHGTSWLVDGVTEVSSPILSSEVIAALLKTERDAPCRLTINGEIWQSYGGGSFRPVDAGT